MSAPLALICAWARSAVVPHGGAFGRLAAHELAAPVLQGLLERAALPATAVDALVVGNALGAGGNPARMLALAAGLPETIMSCSVDTQCCSGLDAVTLAVGLLASGQAEVAIAGGVEAWSRAPLRLHRPLDPQAAPIPYDRPAFAPDPARDPDLLVAAAQHARRHGWQRHDQDAYAVLSHQRALAAQDAISAEIVPVAGVSHDLHPRPLSLARAARLPVAVRLALDEADGAPAAPEAPATPDCSLSALTIAPRADGAAFVLLATAAAAARLGLRPRAAWLGARALGGAPENPLVQAAQAARQLLQRHDLDAAALHGIELHDAFAVQGLDFAATLGLPPEQLNRRGGGLARGHPIGASAAVALVRLLADLTHAGRPGALGLTAVAGAGGIGSAALLQALAG